MALVGGFLLIVGMERELVVGATAAKKQLYRFVAMDTNEYFMP